MAQRSTRCHPAQMVFDTECAETVVGQMSVASSPSLRQIDVSPAQTGREISGANMAPVQGWQV
jgi:hypothetical protein